MNNGGVMMMMMMLLMIFDIVVDHFYTQLLSDLERTRCAHVLQCIVSCFVVSNKTVHRTWTSRSLSSVCDLLACVYKWGTSVYSLIQRTVVESVEPARNWTPEKREGGRRA